jgi:hypothetical protein
LKKRWQRLLLLFKIYLAFTLFNLAFTLFNLAFTIFKRLLSGGTRGRPSPWRTYGTFYTSGISMRRY